MSEYITTSLSSNALNRQAIKSDRVMKAALLYALGHVSQVGPERWSVKSERIADKAYTVTPDGCECPDGQKFICKHLLAVFFDATAVIAALRKVVSTDRARYIVALFAEQLEAMPRGIQQMVRRELEQACERLRSIPAFVKPHEQYVTVSEREAVILTDQPGYPYEDQPGWYYRIHLLEPNWTSGHYGPFDTSDVALEHAKAHLHWEWHEHDSYLRSKWGY